MTTQEWPLGRFFSFLTKQYIGKLAIQMEKTPVERYYFPLYLIGKKNGIISQQELANQLLMDKVSLVRILDALESDGFIERKTNPNDRRQHLLNITSQAEPWIGEIEKGIKETNEYFFSLLDPSLHATFELILTELITKTQEIPADQFEFFYPKKLNS
ncbi:MarR family winged helix-turn-helix transcriptional regulator [Fluviicola taffensis]|uniref:Regulatory protein MarR n=1 Tax=Fluviicola taffensis (strain DSM 16823 / NCIMB 13979 / RW262) TaxID=755732 RepID=F2IE50_FLUTR|nr:MarR family transcriptional regulator [Fluviicola taffensis]AEA42368.1 regulatory protein MarR [Fluviicola taffensis DSM 16823]